MPNIITRVKMMVAPEGILRKQEKNNPEMVPKKANNDEKTNSLLKSFVKRLAVACGIVSNDKMSMMPTTRIFNTTVRAIKVMVK